MIRHNRDVADLHGKQPVIDSLFAGGKKRKVRIVDAMPLEKPRRGMDQGEC